MNSIGEAHAEFLCVSPFELPARRKLDSAVEWAQALCQHLVSKREVPTRAVELLNEHLSAVMHDGFVQSAIGYVATANCTEVRDALFGYLERFVEGHEREIGEVLPRLNGSDALRLLRLLFELKTVDALEAMGDGLRSPFELVRLQTLAYLTMVPGLVAWEWIAPLLVDSAPALRRQALELCVEWGFPEAGFPLSRRIRGDEFDRLSDWEKRLLFEAASSVSFKRAEILAIAVLEDVRLFSAAHDQSRAIAAEFLARSDAQDALEALERHAARRFSNAPSVRSVAQRSAQVVRRRSTRPPAS